MSRHEKQAPERPTWREHAEHQLECGHLPSTHEQVRWRIRPGKCGMSALPRRQAHRLKVRGIHDKPWSRGVEAKYLTFSPSENAQLLELADVIDYQTAGTVVFSQGEEARFLYLLGDGLVRSFHTLLSGERQVLSFLWPGDLIGLSENSSYVASAQTITASRVYRFAVSELEPFLLRHPKVQDRFLVKTIHELRAAQRQLIVMGKLDIPRRVAAFLLDCSAHEFYFDSSEQVLTLPMSRDDIADYLGTSAETVIRTLAQLEKGGLVQRLEARRLRLEREKLRAFCELD